MKETQAASRKQSWPEGNLIDRYLTLAEVAAVLRRSPRTIRDWVTTGCPTPHGRIQLEAVKLGRAWTVRQDWLVVFEHRVRPHRLRSVLVLDDEI